MPDTLEVDFRFSGKTDEFWSFVRNKNTQRRTWYATERKSGCILVRHNVKGSDRDFLILWNLLSVYNIKKYYPDGFGSYSKYIPSHQHRVGKDSAWKIERKNLNFRTHLKRLNRKPFVFQKMNQFTTMSQECILRNSITKQELVEIIVSTNLRHYPNSIEQRCFSSSIFTNENSRSGSKFNLKFFETSKVTNFYIF
jgi:insertion element IS1 protein InsB